MRKVLILLGLTTILFAVYYSYTNKQLPVFLMTEKPNVVAKGHNGHVFLVELHFEHDGLIDFINSDQSRNILFLLDPDLIKRADHLLELLQSKQRATGLLGSSPENIQQEIAVYEQTFKQKPLWYMPQGYTYTDELRQTLFSQQINMLVPTLTIKNNSFPKKIEKGDILSLPLYKENKVEFKSLSNWMKKYQFISIEESLFGYSIKTKKSP
ncbi:hypothetical protein [Lysinibacillus sp. 3P01SB]|uniref:hypothetical protein n=1 Tax=Lysinibacillus sp. 3P01SB TaxID=3132284 RepID=UPI0039A569E3